MLLSLLFVKVAASAEPGGIDAQALPLPISAETASVLESSRRRHSGEFVWTLRTSGLRRPLTLRLPSASPEGTSVGLVDGVFLSELSANVGVGKGWDMGVGFGAQLTRIEGSSDSVESMRSVGLRGRDPRIGAGWAIAQDAWSFRPFAQVHLPLGDDDSFSGEPTARLLVGASGEFDGTFLRWSFQSAYLHRPFMRISSTTWGPQLLVGTGVFLPLIDTLEIGTQIIISPVLAPQRGMSGRPGGRMIPAEALGSVRYSIGSFTGGLGVGVGLPLSRTSTVHVDRQSVRGPTTPVYRGFFDLTYEK